MTLLEKLGIYGLEEIENHIFAGLVTGDPVLLVGRHGSAKTMLARKIAECLDAKFIAYDASKALFDDVIGFPNPKTLANGVLDYIPTPISIWDKEFVLIDEISRANTSMQNKWLEIIRSRQLMGKAIPNLKYVFSAMNPASIYSGAVALDPALSGRFAFVLLVPEVFTMSTDNIKNIMMNLSDDDGVALKRSANEPGQKKAALAIRELIDQSRNLYPKIAEKYNEKLSEYIVKFASNMLINKIKVDGRRLGMIRRNCIGYLSVKSVQMGAEVADNKFHTYVYECIKYSLPDETTGETLKEDIIMSAHALSLRDNTRSKKCRLWAEVVNTDSIEKMVDLYIKYYHELDEFNHQEISYLLNDKNFKSTTAIEFVDLLFAVKKLIAFYGSKEINERSDVVGRIFQLYADLFFLTGRFDSAAGDRENSERKFMFINFADKNSETAFRLAFNTNSKGSYKKFNAKMYDEILLILEMKNEDTGHNQNKQKQ